MSISSLKTVHDRVRWLRETKYPGHGGKSAFAKALGILLTSYVRYEMTVVPGIEMVAKMMEVTNVNPRWLQFGIGERLLPDHGRQPALQTAAELIDELSDENDKLRKKLEGVAETEGTYGTPPALVVVPAGVKPDEWIREHGHVEAELERCVLVPILAGRVAAGAPRNVMEHEKSGWAVTYRSAIRNPRTTSAIRVDGDSMEPHIPDGSLVWIDYSVRDPAVIVRSKHKIAAIRVDDGVVIRRVSKADGHWLFLPENETAQNRPAVWAAGEGDNPVVGKMVAMWAKFD